MNRVLKSGKFVSDNNTLKKGETLKIVTKNQLALRNGVDKEDIWVAFEGNVYDVGSSRLWRGGKHYEHWAGQDLTDELKDAPHTAKVFEKFEIIGKLS
jgi:predicted heme/steroid binding protein